jgi:hypothetical protein
MVEHNKLLRWASWSTRFDASFDMIFLVAVTGFLALLLWGTAPALAQEQQAISQEESPPAQLGEDVTPMDKSFQEEKFRLPRFFPWLKEELKDAPPFFRDTKLDLNVRTYDLSRDKFDNSDLQAWALGGSLSYRSGWFLDHFGVGSTLYTSQPLDAPDDKDGTLLLKPGQEGYTVVGQLYGKVKLVEDNFINIYRSEYNTPYMNKNDSRMTPNTFEGYTITGVWGGKNDAPKFNYGAGYIDKIKPRNSDTFIPMSEAAGADVNRGVVVSGANGVFGRLSIGAVNYYSDDIINIGYFETKYNTALTDCLGLLVSVQFSDQRSVGEELLQGHSFQTNQPGVKTELSYREGILTLAYTADSKGANLQSPWSSYPGYTSVQVQDFNRAGEEAFMVKGSYDFSKLMLQGVTAYALWVHGWNAVDPGTKADVYDQDEYDYDLQWRPKGFCLEGLWFRLRYAHIDQRGEGDATMDDFRVIVNYDLALL